MDDNNLIVKSLETEPVKNLLGPITKELGLIGGDIAGILRFYTNQNLQKIFTKWAEQRHQKGLPSDTNMGKLLPLIQLASLQDNEELQECWAALLNNAVTTPDGVLPSFGQTLSQLTPREARYIDRLHAHVEARKRFNRSDIGNEDDLRGLYDERLRVMSYADAQALKAELGQAQLAIDDLKRLAIIAEQQEVEQLRLAGNDPRSIAAFLKKVQDVELVSTYTFTEYGSSFVRAVTPVRQTNSGYTE